MAESSTRSSTEAAPTAGRRSGRAIRRMWRAIVLIVVGAAVMLAFGLYWFVQHLPDQEIELGRSADGIVALTGGASRVTDAIELLAAKRGRRLLISGANPATDAKEISRLHPEYAAVVRCCVDFDTSVNTLGNAIETRKWVERRKIRSLIVVTSGYHVPRAMAEIAHQVPDVTLIAFPVISEQSRSEPWWPDRARRVTLEYLKFLFAHARMRLHPGAGSSD
jgi:uncharacterized SAM-binding protein YcdF (DUF218 family)